MNPIWDAAEWKPPGRPPLEWERSVDADSRVVGLVDYHGEVPRFSARAEAQRGFQALALKACGFRQVTEAAGMGLWADWVCHPD
eukprot:2433834-Heterocapsa_arctica.AAC.1